MRAIVTAVLVAGALAAPALAAPTCLVEIDGKRLLDGPCEAFRGQEDRLALRGSGGAAVVLPFLGDSDHAHGAWSGAHGGEGRSFGPLERDGVSCWRGSGSRVCAW